MENEGLGHPLENSLNNRGSFETSEKKEKEQSATQKQGGQQCTGNGGDEKIIN